MPIDDDFRSSLELLLEDKKSKLLYYQKRIDDYVNRSAKTKADIERLEKALKAKLTPI